MAILKQIINDLADIVCPEVCLGCGKRFVSNSEHLICINCLNSLPKASHFDDDDNVVMFNFFAEQIPIEYGACYLKFSNDGLTRNLMHNIKYNNHPELGKRLGKMAAIEMKKFSKFSTIDYILPVPMHPDKIKVRGFNQTEYIAQGISEILNVPICNQILSKIINSKTQTYMTRDERMHNSQQIFTATKIDELANCHFMIVDDVFTTGATLMACTQKVKTVMPNCKVSVFAIAKA